MKDWYDLIEKVKSSLLVDGAEPLVEDPAAYNAVVAGITWHNLKEKLIELLALINHDATNLDIDIQWYTIRENIEAIETYFA